MICDYLHNISTIFAATVHHIQQAKANATNPPIKS